MRSTLWLLILACALGACDIGHEDTTSTASSQLGTVLLPTTGWGDPGVTSSVDTYGRVSWVGGDWRIPITLPAGSPLSSVSIPIVDNGAQNGHPTDGNTVTAFIGTPGGGTFNALLFTTSAGTGAPQSLVLTFQSPHVIADGEQLQVLLHPQKPGPFGPTPATVPSAVSGLSVSTQLTMVVGPSEFVTEDPGHPVSYLYGPVIGTSLAVRAGVHVTVGHQIFAVRATVIDNARDPNAKLGLQLISMNSNGTNVLAFSSVSTGSGTIQVLSMAPSVTIAPHTAYFLRVYALGIPSAEDELYFAEVDYN